MRGTLLRSGLSAMVLLAGLIGSGCSLRPAAQATVPGRGLSYRVSVTPSSVTLARGGGPTTARIQFVLEVTNAGSTAFTAVAPSAKTFDVAVMRASGSAPPLWTWSAHRMFAQVETPVNIATHKSWRGEAVWEPRISDLPEGAYKVAATFVATGVKTEARFDVK